MDRLYYASFVIRERQNEISKDLAVRRMLKEANENQPGISKSKRMVLRFVPVIILASLIAFHLGS